MMDTRGGEQGLVARFLGSGAAEGGLHALLGVATHGATEEDIVGALERRLTLVDGHPQGRTPEADEVRLALHAAAAQLLSQAGARRRSQGGETVAAKRPASGAGRARMLEQDALLTLARYGGWNRRSLRRLTMLAFARGGKAGDVVTVLEHLAGRRGPADATHRRRPGPGMASEPRSVAIPRPGGDDDEGAPGRLRVVVAAVATLLTLVVGAALVLVAVSSGRPKAGEEEAPEAADRGPFRPEDLPMQGGEELFPWAGGEKPVVDGAGGTPPEPAAPAFERLSDAVAALDSAVGGLELDPAQAVRVFDGAVAGVGSQWCNLTLPQLRAAQHDVVEFVYRAVQRPDLSASVVEAVARGARPLATPDRPIGESQIWPAAWSVGLLARLGHERDIGAVASRQIEAALRESIGSAAVAVTGFEQGAHAALWAMLPALIADAEGETPEGRVARWERWIDAARAGADGGQAPVLGALEWATVYPTEPTDSEGVRAAIESLTLACDWGEGSPARAWLIRTFADARVTNADLHALTTALSRRSRAPGIDVTMALPVRADTDARELLRERYAAAWAIETSGPTLDDLAADWAKAAAEVDRDGRDDQTMIERLSTACAFSRLSQAAQLRREGLLDEAGVVIDEYNRPVEAELTAWAQRRSPDSIDGSPGMSQWALSYLSAQRDFARRLELLTEAARLRISHPTDAEVLVGEAVRGSPAQARAAARDSLLAQSPGAVLTLAMLELAPKMPRTAQNAELVAALTTSVMLPVDDPDWRVRTRRVLVQTALEQLAAEGDQGLVDRLASVLGESYTARAVSAPADSAALPDMPPDQAAALLRVRAERLARRGGLGPEALEVESVLSRHASRQALAEGPVQAFAVEQLASFELSCIAVASERLGRAPEVNALGARVRTERREAGDIVEQIVIVERAFVELWAISLGQESPWRSE